MCIDEEIMEELVDKALLTVIGILLVNESDCSERAVTALLLGVIMAAAGSFIKDWRVYGSCVTGYLAGCFFVPELLYFLPLLFYDCAKWQCAWLFYGSAPLLFFCFYYKGAAYGILFADSRELPLWFMLLCASFLLGDRTAKNERLKQQLIHLRDTDTELNLVLREKNKTLLEKQEYEIYLATLRERNRIAREIHDNVGHMLTRSILQLGALQVIHKEEPLYEQLVSVNATLNQAMNSIRESVHDLHDDAVDLRQAIAEATCEMAKEYRLTIDYDMSPEIPGEVKYCLLAAVKEAISNVVKHSNADAVTILLREHPAFYQLSVEDNGTPKAAGKEEQLSEGGMGLFNMQERVESLRGTFRIHRENGFRIFISIPKEQM